MLSDKHIAVAKVPRKTVKKTTVTTAKQEVLFEKDLPPLTASVQQTFSGDVFLTMFGVAAVLAITAMYVVRKADITV